MFSEASNVSAGVDKVFAFIIIISLIFLIGISVFIVYTLVRFRRKKGLKAMQFTDNIKLEIIWTVIPIILVLLMFYYGWIAFAPMRKAPPDAMQVKVIGKMWEWIFDYGNGMTSKELVIPLNKAVRLDLVSEDVNHGFFIPAFRVKEDVVPGYNNYMWFIPQYIGNYEILCTQYCGLLHSNMMSKVRVVDQEEYEKWYADLEKASKIPEAEGLIVLRNTGCLACHSIDGSKLVGPTFKDFYGSERTVIANNTETKVIADDAFISRSVYSPDAEIAAGYNKGLMKSYTDVLKEEDLKKINDYLKTLHE
ncbi:MAG: cytochrome c oxidase subunit II [Bacteroidales bacterium]|nr:cytochrome c oxidase subunit II [Bacteroidales bacterium]